MLKEYLNKFIIVYLDNIIIYFKIEEEYYKYYYYLFYLLPNEEHQNRDPTYTVL